ncbi:hypothetical protein [Agromyces seonyuensis]|uniref:Uncharacterized protein n=1 Tax=Agromyces seonyuensis TaxID=2662446 RepID=A0A6I4NS58_9MICO|nr:hypothetical protein [Agromyces seonyuensis]MWB96951.1 hypothetical protein [Agromyces seonyuensis]
MQNFHDRDPFTTLFSKHRTVTAARSTMLASLAAGKSNSVPMSLSLGGADGVSLCLENLAMTYVGSYAGTVRAMDIRGHTATLMFTATNTSSLASALHLPYYGMIPGYESVEAWQNSLAGDSGPMSPTSQTTSWSEQVTF